MDEGKCCIIKQLLILFGMTADSRTVFVQLESREYWDLNFQFATYDLEGIGHWSMLERLKIPRANSNSPLISKFKHY